MWNMGFGTYALMLAIVLWGVLLGGVVYSHLVFFPVFLGHLPESAAVVNGPYGLNEAVFWMTIHPLLILSLVISLIANWRVTGRRNLIAMSLGVYAVIIVVSMAWFVPQLIEFAKSPQSSVPAAEWHERGQRWQYLSWIRGSILFVFSVPLLTALARPRITNEPD